MLQTETTSQTLLRWLIEIDSNGSKKSFSMNLYLTASAIVTPIAYESLRFSTYFCRVFYNLSKLSKLDSGIKIKTLEVAAIKIEEGADHQGKDNLI